MLRGATQVKHRNRPICKPCMIADDGAGGIALYAPVETSNVVDLIQPGELDSMFEACGAERQPKAPDILATIRQWVNNRLRIGKW